MKGIHHIVIETARLKYEFDIRRNITVIKGNSATGKTTLVGLLQAYAVNGRKSGVRLNSDVPCFVYSGDMNSWEYVLAGYHGGIIFIDEDCSFMLSTDFARFIQHTDNYYVLITRRDLVNLPYSINEIYGIRTTGKYHFPQKIYNEFYHIYSEEYDDEISNPVLITEDSNSGFQFFSKVCGDITCLSAEGNAKVFKKISEMSPEKKLIVIADGAAFGAYIEKVMSVAEMRENIMLYFPESFEWMILKSGVIDSKKIEDILESPEKYIESSEYFSWEQFFTDILKSETGDDPVKKYDKSTLNGFYMSKINCSKILNVLPAAVRKAISEES